VEVNVASEASLYADNSSGVAYLHAQLAKEEVVGKKGGESNVVILC
jgi:hypothetical protein